MSNHARWDRPTESEALRNVVPPVLDDIVDADENSAGEWSFFDEATQDGFQIVYANAALCASEGDGFVPTKKALRKSYNQAVGLCNRLLGESLPTVNRRGRLVTQ